jgi:hypothetical protein
LVNTTLQRALEELDAALFSSDTFNNPAAFEVLHGYLVRWRRRMVEIRREIEAADDAKCLEMVNSMRAIVTARRVEEVRALLCEGWSLPVALDTVRRASMLSPSAWADVVAVFAPDPATLTATQVHDLQLPRT